MFFLSMSLFFLSVRLLLLSVILSDVNTCQRKLPTEASAGAAEELGALEAGLGPGGPGGVGVLQGYLLVGCLGLVGVAGGLQAASQAGMGLGC